MRALNLKQSTGCGRNCERLNTGAAVVGKVQEGADAQVTVLGDTVSMPDQCPKCAEVKILSLAGFSVISRLDGDRELRFLVADRGGAAAVPGLASGCWPWSGRALA